VNLPKSIESSYRIISGIASRNCDITSGGVIIAARIKKTTTKWLRYSANLSTVVNSSFNIRITMSGSWKVIPSEKVRRNTK
jgi:hypothetical protein